MLFFFPFPFFLIIIFNHEETKSKGVEAYQAMNSYYQTIKFTSTQNCPYPDCKIVSQSKTDMVDHINRAHIQYNQFICENCGKGYKAKRELKRHQKTIHEGFFLSSFPTKIFISKKKPKKKN